MLNQEIETLEVKKKCCMYDLDYDKDIKHII